MDADARGEKKQQPKAKENVERASRLPHYKVDLITYTDTAEPKSQTEYSIYIIHIEKRRFVFFFSLPLARHHVHRHTYSAAHVISIRFACSLNVYARLFILCCSAVVIRIVRFFSSISPRDSHHRPIECDDDDDDFNIQYIGDRVNFPSISDVCVSVCRCETNSFISPPFLLNDFLTLSTFTIYTIFGRADECFVNS